MGANGKANVAIGKAAKEKDYATIRLKAKEIVEEIDAAGIFPTGEYGRKVARSPGYLGKTR